MGVFEESWIFGCRKTGDEYCSGSLDRNRSANDIGFSRDNSLKTVGFAVSPDQSFGRTAPHSFGGVAARQMSFRNSVQQQMVQAAVKEQKIAFRTAQRERKIARLAASRANRKNPGRESSSDRGI